MEYDAKSNTLTLHAPNDIQISMRSPGLASTTAKLVLEGPGRVTLDSVNCLRKDAVAIQGRTLPDMAGYDGSIYPAGMEQVPYKLAIPRLNCLMVQEASHVIAYAVHSYGGAATTLKQARRREQKNELILLNIGCPHKISLLSAKNIDFDGSVL